MFKYYIFSIHQHYNDEPLHVVYETHDIEKYILELCCCYGYDVDELFVAVRFDI